MTQPDLIFQIGVAPVRIDVVTDIDGVDFSEAWPERLVTSFGDQEVSVLSLVHLLQNKKAADRLQDRADVVVLEALIEARRRQED